jgi:hypothetical protein
VSRPMFMIVLDSYSLNVILSLDLHNLDIQEVIFNNTELISLCNMQI